MRHPESDVHMSLGDYGSAATIAALVLQSLTIAAGGLIAYGRLSETIRMNRESSKDAIQDLKADVASVKREVKDDIAEVKRDVRDMRNRLWPNAWNRPRNP